MHLSSATLNGLRDGLSDIIYLIDPKTSRILDCNRAGYETLGLSRDDVLRLTVADINSDVAGDIQWQEIADTIRKQTPYVFLGTHKRSDGTTFPVEVYTNTVYEDGVEYFVSVARDINLRNSRNADIIQDDILRTVALHEASDGLWDLDLTNNVVYYSPRWLQLMGYGPHEITPTIKQWESMVHPEDKERVMGEFSMHLDGQKERYECQYRLKHRNDEYLWVYDRGFVVARDEHNTPLRIIGLVLDMTDTHRLRQELIKQAQFDDLTGLYNRRTGYEKIEAQLLNHNEQNVHIVMFDLDDFKQINDEYGHLVGDKALKLFANFMRGHIGAEDTLFRWGGEEFLMLCPNQEKDYVIKKVRQGLQHLAQSPLEIDVNQFLTLSASAGMSSYPSQGINIEQLIKHADDALLNSKRTGKNTLTVS